jgi:hypothetical protein
MTDISNNQEEASEDAVKKEWIGASKNFSFEEAFKDALAQAPQDGETDYYKFQVTDISFEKGGFLQVENLLVTIKQVFPE